MDLRTNIPTKCMQYYSNIITIYENSGVRHVSKWVVNKSNNVIFTADHWRVEKKLKVKFILAVNLAHDFWFFFLSTKFVFCALTLNK